MCFRKCRKSSVIPPSHNSFSYTENALTLNRQELLNASKLYTSLCKDEILFPEKIEQYSPVMPMSVKIFVPVLRVKTTNSILWATLTL